MSLSDPNNQKMYVDSCWKLHNAWAGLAAPERMNRLLACVNSIFSSMQVPNFASSMGKALGGSNAQLDFATWTIQMDPVVMKNNNLDREVLGSLATTMYHESRHGEQWYRVAQAVAKGVCVPAGVAAANTKYGVTAQQIATALWIPTRIALDAEQKKRFFPTPMTALVTGWFNSIYGTNAAHRQTTLAALSTGTTASYSAYRHLPEEDDAFSTEQAIRRLWKEKLSDSAFEDAGPAIGAMFR